MNAENLYKIHFEATRPPSSPEELVKMNGVLMIHNKQLNNYLPVTTMRNNIYRHIDNCITARNNKPSPLFICSCGVCSQYLMGIMCSKMAADTKLETDENILNGAMNEVFPTSLNGDLANNKSCDSVAAEKHDTSSQISNACKKVGAHHLDGAIVGFGKNKDKTYKDVFDNDRGYCIWCIENCAIERSKHNHLNQKMLMFVSYAKQKMLGI